jgi:hypothetical protein
LNTLINGDNVSEFFGTIEVKVAPEDAEKSLDDLKGKYIVRALEPGQNLYKASVGKDPIKIEEPVTPPAPMETKPTPVITVPVKKKYPRYEQVLQSGGQAGSPSTAKKTPKRINRKP